ncbi:MAG: phosphodiester glycosidase family protein [Nitrospira sp.]|nr:phosphodiester glycosidase family protein [Nitrospira sp.]MDH4355504.1 phosphodiester glycosidase family protein [Nitrospira sp.]MDH5317742.1 phosphodiester glycosidase family protein [Nitrospira sp.]
MLVVDLDPERIKFSVHYYAQEGLSEPHKIDQWQKRTGHHVVFNAGLFRENFAYLGLLYKDGHPLGSRRHPSWQGLFVAEPSDSGLRKARVLDLDSEAFDEEQPPYREVAQALMLLDHTGRVRVRESGKYAYQTIVAETMAGHILLLKSLGAARLYDIAQCVKDVLPTVRQAMAMDGGSSSDIRILESLWQKDIDTEDRTSWKSLFAGNTGSHIPLPTVIGASPRE